MGKKKKQEKEKKRKEKAEKLLNPEKNKKEKKPKVKEQTEVRAQAEVKEQLEVRAQAEAKEESEAREQPAAVPAGVTFAEVLRALGDESRMQILDLLKDQGEMCAGQLLQSVKIVQSTLSHHMKVLTETGIVHCRRQGKWSYYSINKEMLKVISECVMKWG